MTMSAANMREAAIAAERAGRLDEAARLFAHATATHALDAALLNSAGSFHARQRDHAAALDYFDRALEQAPDYGEAVVNRAITLSALDREGEALAALQSSEGLLAHDSRYWSARAAIERGRRDLAATARSYDRCLAIDPLHTRGLHGRARMALERGELDMVARFQQALALTPGDAELWLGYAQAMEIGGHTTNARTLLQTLVEQAPGWTDALELLARRRWSSGEAAAFCDHYSDAATRRPNDPEIIRSWCRMLAGVDRFTDAADVAATARSRFPGIQDFALIEAAYAGEGGDDARADAIFSTLSIDTDERRLHEARHHLRLDRPVQADALLEDVIANQPDHIAAWALRDLAWRVLDDPRHHWMHAQPGLISTQAVEIEEGVYGRLLTLLSELHDRADPPVGQSVRGGTQTRGGLFDRTEREIAELKEAIQRAIGKHRASLPPADPRHPLLRYRDKPWRIVGSWSIRLIAAGRHVEHIHPHGIISSAVHLIVPKVMGEGSDSGALELGRSPPDLRLNLPPIATIEPRAGFCVLFPSTLYHGTRHFADGNRMTAAFDVAH